MNEATMIAAVVFSMVIVLTLIYAVIVFYETKR